MPKRNEEKLVHITNTIVGLKKKDKGVVERVLYR